MVERSNKVMNVGRAKFIELVLDVLQLLTLEELHYAITKIIKEVTCQKRFLTKLREVKEVFALGMRSTSFAINLLISLIDSQHFPSAIAWL